MSEAAHHGPHANGPLKAAADAVAAVGSALQHAADSVVHKAQDVGKQVMSGVADVAVVGVTVASGPPRLEGISSVSGLYSDGSSKWQERQEIREAHR